MADQQTPSPEVADVIDSLPQAVGETQDRRKRAYKKRRRKKTARSSASARDAFKLNIPSSDEEPRSKMFLTTVANLALLVAVLTIVFAAHRAVQNNRQQQTIDHRPETIDQKQEATERAIDNRPQTQQTIDNRPETIDQKQEATERAIDKTTQVTEKVEQEPAVTEQTADNRPETIDQEKQPAKPVKVAKPAKRVNPYATDPYTNGGPLDLDRRGDAQAAPTLPGTRSGPVTDSRNPWNSGGSLDLDSETNRQQYKKALSLAE